MLTRLHVRNYVLIDSLEIEFPEGLIIITGQTGAGKSILLGALSLLMGGKADASAICAGADSLVVEAEFSTSDKRIRAILDENDIDWEDGHLIVRRTVNVSGRSRAFVNDSPVPVGVLQEISSLLVDIHSQHQNLLLSQKQFQMDILDHFAGNMELRSRYLETYRKLSSLRAELSEVEAQIAKMTSESEYNQARFNQLDSARLRDGELAELEAEQKQLANAEEIKNSLCAAEALFSPSAETGAMSLTSSLKEISRNLAKISVFVPSAVSLSERLDVCRLELEDISEEVSSLNERTELSQDRLEQVEDRMSLIYELLHRFDCRTEAELIEVREKLSNTLLDSTMLQTRKEEIAASIASISAELDSLGTQLSEKRHSASGKLATEIMQSLHYMELPFAVFDVKVEDAQEGPSGKDAVTFTFSASGSSPMDVAKCASGGELSRIMLSLKALMARFTKMPTMIFDEIDTGISGSVADRIGSVICSMGENMQVFAITHLPQVAAKGNAHYLVSKEINPDTSVAKSSIKKLDKKERVLEVARMLSGAQLTPEAIANAESLISQS